jgi:transcription antitermination factor NusG
MENKTTWILELLDKVTGPVNSIGAKLNGVKTKMDAVKKASDRVPNSIQALQTKLDNLNTAKGIATSEKAIIGLNREIRQTQKELNRLDNLPPRGFMSRMRELPSMAKTAIAGAAVGVVSGLFAGFGAKLIEITGKFQTFEAVLTNTLGSNSAARSSLQMITDFAAKTPYQVDDLTDSFIKLANRGVVLTRDQMTKIGDVAAVLGKPFSQLNEAILDINNPERWKEIGVKAQTVGDKVRLSFKGQTVEVERTEKGVLKAIEAFGKMEGVAGTMAVISETLQGKISNLGDAWDQMFIKIGQSTGGVLGSIVEMLSSTVSWFTRNLDVIGSVVRSLGLATAAYLLMAGAQLIAAGGISATLIPALVALKVAIWNIPIIGWVAAALGALYFFFDRLYERSDEFRLFMYQVSGVVGAVFDKVIQVFKGLWTALSGGNIGTAINQIQKGLSGWSTVIETATTKAWTKFQTEKNSEAKEKYESKLKDNKQLKDLADSKEFAPVSGNPLGTGAVVPSGSSGGGRNVTITIQNLVQGLTISTTNISESAARIQAIVADALVRAINDAELATS